MWPFRKLLHETDETPHGKSGKPFILSDDNPDDVVNVQILISKVGRMEYAVWATNSGKFGSFELDLWGEVRRAYRAAVLQGKQCHIQINRFGGSEAEKIEQHKRLGGMVLNEKENFFDVFLDLADRYVSDLTTLIHGYRPAGDSILRLRLDIAHERRFAEWPAGSKPRSNSDRVITYEIVRLFCWHDTEELEVSPWIPDASEK